MAEGKITALVTGANRGIGLELCRQLKERGATVIGVCRGASADLGGLGVETGMTDNQGYIDTPEAASGLLARLDDLTLESSGGFWHANGERLPW